ncbi:bis(5'-nucleosyl)-tetraphosphatase (symmetrical) YqeK [Paenibacillus harenae]|uniref:bis(5'-nucleosyl)-tetraphosphatase (symmetrical) YqeK n=1 Tax=Paenibacillus harenae TaxID=306543 RepID=UPI002791FEE8|nr:bis(5'-nucleosyl)-tetraphosphatase (symmetrical) YqeK [Paenibacillus harenae]MDQ0062874.1 putative HD superfamily hydrolase involved in NAD metabolism [Paenibacillus harenae]
MNEVLQPYVQGFQATGNLRMDIKQFFEANNDLESLDHTYKVAGVALRVAERYEADSKKAVMAAFLHDISNVIPVSDMMVTAEKLGVAIMDEERTYARIVHQKLSRAMAAPLFGIEDEEILNAIECHTTLKAQSTLLDKVLFISDKMAWELPGEHPYLQDIKDKVNNDQLIEGILIYLDHLWDNRANMKLVHPWLIAAREELSNDEYKGY